MPVQTRRATRAVTNAHERAAIDNDGLYHIPKLQVLTVQTNVSTHSLCSSCFDSPLSLLSDEGDLVSNGDLFASLFEGPLTPLPSEMLMDIDDVPPHALPPPLTTDSTFDSIFDGPLTPLPSDTEETDDHPTVIALPSDLVDDKALTVASQSARKKFDLNRPRPSLFDEANNVLHFHAPTVIKDGVQGEGQVATTHTFRPSASSLTETPTPSLPKSIRHWRMGPGGLKPVFDDDDDDEMHDLDVVARESKKLIKQKEVLMQTLNAVDTGTREELTMEDKIALIQKALEVNKNVLPVGPEGTEIFHDEIDYPMQPMDKQSTSMQVFPTEIVIT